MISKQVCYTVVSLTTLIGLSYLFSDQLYFLTYWSILYPVTMFYSVTYFIFSNIFLPTLSFTLYVLAVVCFLLIMLLGTLLIPTAVLISVAVKNVPDEISFYSWMDQLIKLGYTVDNKNQNLNQYQKIVNWVKIKIVSKTFQAKFNTVFTYWGICRIAYCTEVNTENYHIFVGVLNTWIPIS